MPFLVPQVRDGCFLQSANTFRADNLGILCVWYTYYTAAQLPWCASNIYLKGKKNPNPPQSVSSTAFAAEASHITFHGELTGCWSFCLFIFFGSVTPTASKEGGENIWEDNLYTVFTALPRRVGTVFTLEPLCAGWVKNSHIPPQNWQIQLISAFYLTRAA